MGQAGMKRGRRERIQRVVLASRLVVVILVRFCLNAQIPPLSTAQMKG